MNQKHIIIATDLDYCLTLPTRHNDPWPSVMPGAHSALRLLKLILNAEIAVITSRPRSSDPVNQAWLGEYFTGLVSGVFYEETYRANYGSILPLSSYKGLIARDLGARVLIDDTPLHVLGALAYDIELPILFGPPSRYVKVKLEAPAVNIPIWPEVCYQVVNRFSSRFR
jgi:hypothetical protein